MKMKLIVNLLKIVGIIAIAAGFFLKKDGLIKDDMVMKCGIAVFVTIIVLSLINIPKHSRGKK